MTDSELKMVYDIFNGDGDKYQIKPKKKNEAQIRANAKYDKTHTKGLYLKFNKITDKDILEKLETVENKQKYIKDLIRADIK